MTLKAKTLIKVADVTIVLIGLYIVVSLYGAWAFNRNCKAKGGVPLHQPYENVCLKPSAVL